MKLSWARKKHMEALHKAGVTRHVQVLHEETNAPEHANSIQHNPI